MDIIDIILGKALTPQGKTTAYLAKAEKAAQAAAAAKTSADNAVAAVESITEQTNANNASAQEALAAADEALERVNSALETLENEGITTETIDDEIDNLLFSITSTTNTEAVTNHLMVDYPSGETDRIANLVVMYQSEGQNTNGTMTQKAITNYIAQETSTLTSTINTLDTRLTNAEFTLAHGGGSGAGNLGPENAGNIVVIGESGEVTSGDTSEAEIIEALIKSGSYSIKNAAGIDLDYENKVYDRTQTTAYNYSAEKFNSYAMFGGRMRCNVSNNGTITAWYGDENYREDGSNGQVMVYQPKFYYARVPLKTIDNVIGKIVYKESLILSATRAAGLKIHPLFINADGEEVDYVLLSAYEGSIYDSVNSRQITDDSAVDITYAKLSSVANVKPASGKNITLTTATAEQLARNRGEGWHISNMRSESASQMLMMTEFGSPNGQVSMNELGVCNVSVNTNYNCSAYTGSTSALGNATGHADSTIREMNGTTTIGTTNGYRAISYRGVENPWGNLWRYLGDTYITGNGNQGAGVAMVCRNYNYDDATAYDSVGFSLPPATGSFTSALGYGNETYDWVLMPAQANGSSNSAVPIGDGLWATSGLDYQACCAIGGLANAAEKAGMYYYACDRKPDLSTSSYGARLIYIPKLNNIYTSNYQAWRAKWGN